MLRRDIERENKNNPQKNNINNNDVSFKNKKNGNILWN